MSKDQYYKRFESLFSSPDTVAPEPSNGKAAPAEAETGGPNLQTRVAELEAALTAANTARLRTDQALQTLQSNLNKRNSDLDLALEMAHTVTLPDQTELLQSAVELVRSSLNLYSVEVFLLNEAEDSLSLAEGDGAGNREVKETSVHISLDENQSLVARAARERGPVVVNDVSLDAGYLPHPAWPNTKAEMALSLTADEVVLGVLDLQSDTPDRFSAEDSRLAAGLAAQLAVALKGLKPVAPVIIEVPAPVATPTATLETPSPLMGDMVSAAPEALPQTATPEPRDYVSQLPTTRLGFAYDLNEVRPISESEIASNGHGPTLERTLTVAGETIGRLAVSDMEIGDDEAAEIIAAVAEQLGAQVETLHLREQAEKAHGQNDQHEKDIDLLKSAFLTNISHELRTPLNSILGFTQVMLEAIDGELQPAMENDLKVIQKNGQHLLAVINDVLDMSKLKAGKMTLSPEIFDLKEILDEVADGTAPLAATKALTVNLQLDPNANLNIYADRTRLKQVIANLVNNAVKFSEGGQVVVAAERNQAQIEIKVRDNGIGIAPGNLGKIFDEFSQLDKSTTRKAGGSGLGLAISRGLVELHGGKLWAESNGQSGPEGGSTFYIELPVETTYIN
jgi:signal transduction histidine kinase/putative methionine-R-sulfoxide reductase with GAF domain